MSKLTICAHITAKQEHVALIKTELTKLIDASRAELGCINYDLHQDNENPAYFFFYENWESRELWQDHMKTQHIKDYLAASEGAIESLTVNEMTFVG